MRASEAISSPVTLPNPRWSNSLRAAASTSEASISERFTLSCRASDWASKSILHSPASRPLRILHAAATRPGQETPALVASESPGKPAGVVPGFVIRLGDGGGSSGNVGGLGSGGRSWRGGSSILRLRAGRGADTRLRRVRGAVHDTGVDGQGLGPLGDRRRRRAVLDLRRAG